MTKKELYDLNLELSTVFEKIRALSIENPDITLSDEGWKESFSSVVETFDPKLTYFRKLLSKIEDNIPSNRKKRAKRQ